MDSIQSQKKAILTYFITVFLLSIPFYILGAIAGDLTKIIPIQLPISSLMFVCPFLAALVLIKKDHKDGGVRSLFKRAFDFKRINNRIWYLPILLMMPAVMLLSYVSMQWLNLPLPIPEIPLQAIPIFFILFFIGAIGEEIGWTGYITDPMQNQWGALKAGLILGLVWAMWHVIPYIQAHHSAVWIVWQCISTVALRIIIVWLYNRAGKSVFSAILFHTMINTSVFMFPNYGSHYNPLITAIILTIIVVVILLWDRKLWFRLEYN